MRFCFRSVLVLAICLMVSLQNAYGWNAIGHMAVAYVAYQKLTPQQKARVTALLTLNPNYSKWLSYIPAGTAVADRDTYVFMMASTWPDEIKVRDSGYQSDGDTPPSTPEATSNVGYTDLVMHKYWHYVDLPFSSDGTSPLPAVPSPNAETQIIALRTDLASDEPDAVKSYDLVWLLHLVGDIHQPLHCTTRITQAKPNGDLGGNLVTLSGNPNELHAYWDDLLGMGSTQNYSVAVTAAQALAPARAKAAADLKTEDWVNESFALAKSRVYAEPIEAGMGPYTIGKNSKYERQSIAVAKRRVALAGARLANVLNAELK